MRRLAWVLSAIVFFITSSASGAPAEEQQVDAKAQQLLQKHRDYVGWQLGDGTFRTMRVTGTVTDKKGDRLEDVAFSSAEGPRSPRGYEHRLG